MFKCIKLLGLH